MGSYKFINNSSVNFPFARLQWVFSCNYTASNAQGFLCFAERTDSRRGGRGKGDVRRENEKNTRLTNGGGERRDRDENAPRERRGGGISGGFNRRREGSQGDPDSPDKEGADRERAGEKGGFGRGGRGMRGGGGRGGRGGFGQRGGGFGRKREFERRSGSDRS